MEILLYQWWWMAWLLILHPFYVSVTEMQYNAKEQTLEVSCRVFADDLEKALEKMSHVPLDILQPRDKKQLAQLISQYIPQHLRLQVDGKAVHLAFVGYEIEEDAVWSYWQVNEIPTIRHLKVINDILYEQHPEQTNLLHVMVNGKRKSAKLDCPHSEIILQF